MKIALSADGRSPHTQRWADAFAARGHELTVVWQFDHVNEAALARYRPDVQHLARWSPLGLRSNRHAPIERVRTARLAARIKPDIVQGMYLVSCGWTAAAIGRPLVQFALGSDVLALGSLPATSPRRAAGNAYRRWRTMHAVQRADVVLCDSAAIAQSVKTHVPGTRVEIIRIGVELSVNRHSARSWRSELGIAGDALVVLSTRLLTPNYNIETIIRAFASVLTAIPNGVLILKDFHSFGDRSYRERCHAVIRELGIADSVRHVGEINRPDLLGLYRAADIYVSVPTHDANAVSVLEAMAARVPVIAARTEGMDPAVLRDGDSALLVIAEDVPGLAEAIMALHSSPALRSRLMQQGEATVRSIGDFEREIDRAEQLYIELVETV
jgi:glycosyltransferase involved in cell wall biosynthesis